jgi:hypothetical protein
MLPADWLGKLSWKWRFAKKFFFALSGVYPSLSPPPGNEHSPCWPYFVVPSEKSDLRWRYCHHLCRISASTESMVCKKSQSPGPRRLTNYLYSYCINRHYFSPWRYLEASRFGENSLLQTSKMNPHWLLFDQRQLFSPSYILVGLLP